MSNVDVELERVLDFLGESKIRLEDFLAHQEENRKRSSQVYQKNEPGKVSNQNDLLYHSKSWSQENLHQIHQAVLKNLGNDLFNQYVSKY